MVREDNNREAYKLNIVLKNDFNPKDYEKQIEGYLETLVREFEKKGRKKIARRIRTSEIVVSYTGRIGTKRGGNDSSFNEVETERENSKGIKSIVINVKSTGERNKSLFLKITFNKNGTNILSNENLADIKEMLKEIDKNGPMDEKIEEVVLKTPLAIEELVNGGDEKSPIGKTILEVPTAVDKIVSGTELNMKENGDGEIEEIDEDDFNYFIKTILKRKVELERIGDGVFFIPEKIANEILNFVFYMENKEQVIEGIKRILKKSGGNLSQVIRVNISGYEKVKDGFDYATKEIIELLRGGKMFESSIAEFIEYEKSDLLASQELSGKDSDKLQGFFQKLNKGSPRNNQNFRKGFVIKIV